MNKEEKNYSSRNLNSLIFIIIVIILLLSAYSTLKSTKEDSQDRSSLEVKIQALKMENADLKNRLSNLQQENKNLNTTIKEWEGLIPHQGIDEFHVEGTVLALNEEKRILTIEQHLDDNSIKVGPKIRVLPDAIIQERVRDHSGPNKSFKVLKVKNRMGTLGDSIKLGDTVSLIYRNVDKVAIFIRVDSLQ